MRARLLCCAVLIVLITPLAHAQDAATLLKELQQHDAALAAGFTASGTIVGPNQPILSPTTMTRTWRLTLDAERCALLMEVTAHEEPTFRPPLRPGGVDAKGWLYEPLRMTWWAYWGKEFCGLHDEDTLFKVSPADEVVELSKAQSTTLFPPDDRGLGLFRGAICWSMGRFYAKFITTVSSVRKLENGQLAISALGNDGSDRPGRWELIIDPAASWMVREARFYTPLEPEQLDFEMTSTGTEKVGEMHLPKTVRVQLFAGDALGTPIYTLTFNPHLERFDEPLYARAQAAMQLPASETHQIFDHRNPAKPNIRQARELSSPE
jgi:hypothetical protein